MTKVISSVDEYVEIEESWYNFIGIVGIKCHSCLKKCNVIHDGRKDKWFICPLCNFYNMVYSIEKPFENPHIGLSAKQIYNSQNLIGEKRKYDFDCTIEQSQNLLV